ncbi:SDR family oxidoreductase [Polynucleobacter paneuropaeus]|uniref:SDR family oxidoreductase n=1 Tax=Polynucleobacter paneuropaeus TaxID=2527775 RepID=UPI001BFE917C|nr:SDR family oxidoreductase [Polynucleobacter paneuropaeus]QWD52921.1 SDR family oxidoreductase [Polynucleobacter paneuropaeus]QWD57835.1 SDR family oxidoreductase [Polynucleobacter paneuropaeus]
MKKILILGATSAIAEATARIWAQRGDQLFLVARNEECLNLLAKDLKVRGAPEAHGYCMDANNFDQHSSMLDKAFEILGAIDIVLIAHGTLSSQKECERSVDLTMQEIKTNALSVIALLTHLANRFEIQRSGTISVISSVAGDRGRASNYVYGSAKAMVTAFTSGLRQRLYESGVSVVTIKPGFVDTPMTAEFKKGFLWAKPESIVKGIVVACDKKNSEIYLPRFWWAVMIIIKLIPDEIFKKIRL